MNHRVEEKPVATIVAEWDALAPLRYAQITTGRDLTYNYVLLPTITRLVGSRRIDAVLDAGCGVGVLTGRLAEAADRVVGVDPSEISIGIARTHFGHVAEFYSATLEVFSTTNAEAFDVVVANMVLMDVLDLHDFLRAVERVLRPNGRFVFSCTHPWFWPKYYGYADAPWFRYDVEAIVESPFRTSSDREGSLTSTHVHRPLSAYFEAFAAAQLCVTSLYEPMPETEVNALYPRPWDTPRYLVGQCKRLS